MDNDIMIPSLRSCRLCSQWVIWSKSENKFWIIISRVWLASTWWASETLLHMLQSKWSITLQYSCHKKCEVCVPLYWDS